MPFSIFSSTQMHMSDVIAARDHHATVVVNSISIDEGRKILESLSQNADIYVFGFPTLEPLPSYQLNLKSRNPKIYITVIHVSDYVNLFVCFPKCLATIAVYFKLKYGSA